MSLKKIKFGDKEINKKEFYSSKQAIRLDSADLDSYFELFRVNVKLMKQHTNIYVGI